MARSATSIRLSKRTRRLLEELIVELDWTQSHVIERAIEELHATVQPCRQWVGSGPWRGYSMTTEHAASSQGQPVLVTPTGQALGPGDVERALEKK